MTISQPFFACHAYLICSNLKTKRCKGNVNIEDFKTEPQITDSLVNSDDHTAHFQAHTLTSLFSFTATICLSPRALNNLKARKSDEFWKSRTVKLALTIIERKEMRSKMQELRTVASRHCNHYIRFVSLGYATRSAVVARENSTPSNNQSQTTLS